MSEAPCEQISTGTVKWGVGVLITLLIFVGSSLWAASSSASDRVSELKVLEARVNSLEMTVSRISASSSEMTRAASDIRASQSEFQGRMTIQMEYLKSDLTDLKSSAKK